MGNQQVRARRGLSERGLFLLRTSYQSGISTSGAISKLNVIALHDYHWRLGHPKQRLSPLFCDGDPIHSSNDSVDPTLNIASYLHSWCSSAGNHDRSRYGTGSGWSRRCSSTKRSVVPRQTMVYL